MVKIYTKKGDNGMTTIKSKRISKSDPIIEVTGELDFLQSYIGSIIINITDDSEIHFLREIQKSLFLISSYITNYITILNLPTDKIEKRIDEHHTILKPLVEFIYSGINKTEINSNMARVQTRRIEVLLYKFDLGNDSIKQYINRLSDYFFTLVRIYSDKQLTIKIRNELNTI